LQNQNRLIRAFGRKEIWGWPLFWFALPVYFLLSFSFDVFLAQSWRIEWLYIAVLSFAAVALLAYGVKKLVIEVFYARRPAGLINFLSIAVLGAIKNVLVGELSVLFGLVDTVDWAFRIYGGAGLSIGVLLAFVYILGERVDHNSIIAELEATREQLMQHRTKAEELLETERLELMLQTQSTLLPTLDSIQKNLARASGRSSAVEELRELIQNQVRPLSKLLSQTAKKLSIAPAPSKAKKPIARMFQESFLVKPLIAPGSMLVMVLLGNWFLTYIILGIEAATWSILYSLVSWLVIVLAKFLMPNNLKMKRTPGVLLFVLIGFIASNASYWPLKEFSSNFQEDLLLLLVVLNIIGSVVGFAYSKSYQTDRLEAVRQMTRDNNLLAREVALFDQQMWIARRNWSFVVHGTVQAALTAAITRLGTDSEPEQFQVDLALSDLDRAANALSQTPEIEVDLNKALQNISSTWDGICQVKINITERATRALDRNSDARICVNEICKEAVSNAVRHGEAKNIHFEIDRGSEEVLFIKASNDGRGLAKDLEPGVGSRMFDELTMDWSLHRDKSQQKTVLQAQLPLAPIGVA
jgi:signal transduction histidine kinase